jgi:hypothetical protein
MLYFSILLDSIDLTYWSFCAVCVQHHSLFSLRIPFLGTTRFGITGIFRFTGCYGCGSRDSSVGIATGYGLDDQGGAGVRVPVGEKFSLLHIVQTGSGVHPTSYKMGTVGTFPGLKRQGREADHSPPTSAEVKKMWIYTSTPSYVCMA